VAHRCIARLGFPGCAVYWLDEARQVLVQKAAHVAGRPAAPPVEVRVGSGVVGGVALSGRAELVKDTTRDGRYAREETAWPSELTVPIILEGKVTGVIRAGHPEKNFFRVRHRRVLTTLATLCAQKVREVAVAQACRQAERQRLEADKRAAETRLLALRMQMSPHFVFNSLTSVNHFILQKDAEQASALLTKFARLLRQVMENAKTEWVLLRQELDALRLYLELEQLRCEGRFAVRLHVGDEVNPDAVLLPPLLLHPFVENAIWHGLLPKLDGEPLLQIDCLLAGGCLVLRVRDNGIGRAAAGRLYRNDLARHKLHGIRSTHERLATVNQVFGADAQLRIEDLFGATGEPAGTSVTITLRLQQGLG
jgi:LytS/YehU family sensor histidine kinase